MTRDDDDGRKEVELFLEISVIHFQPYHIEKNRFKDALKVTLK